MVDRHDRVDVDLAALLNADAFPQQVARGADGMRRQRQQRRRVLLIERGEYDEVRAGGVCVDDALELIHADVGPAGCNDGFNASEVRAAGERVRLDAFAAKVAVCIGNPPAGVLDVLDPLQLRRHHRRGARGPRKSCEAGCRRRTPEQIAASHHAVNRFP